MSIENETDFESTFEVLKHILTEIESSQPSLALVGKMKDAERLNLELEAWLNSNIRSSISILIATLHFSPREEAVTAVAELRRVFPDHEPYILGLIRTHNIHI